MISRKLSAVFVCALAFGCSSDPKGPGEGQPYGRTGLALSTGLEQSADVDGVRFDITPVDCDTDTPTGDTIVVTRGIQDETLPGGAAELEGQPLDADSAHLFADAFVTLPAGCYDVVATPVTAEGADSELCEPADKHGVLVEPHETTEVFLINQCHGTDPGNIDVIAALNHEPEIHDVSFQDSKIATCDEDVVICATASDPDGDPLEFVWALDPSVDDEVVEGPTFVSSSTDEATGAVTECVSFKAKTDGKFPVSVTVYDQVLDEDGLVRTEDWLADEGYPSESHASNELFFYAVNCKCVETTDVVMFHDLSGSFFDDLCGTDGASFPTCTAPFDPNSVKGQAPALFEALVAAAQDAHLGVASFVDKPITPMGAPGDYVFNIEPGGQLTGDESTFVGSVQAMSIFNGFDGPEAQIEGLMHIGTHAAALGYRPDAKKFVVMMTDAPFHPERDCFVLTGGTACPDLNDGDAIIESSEDYPSIQQVADALIAADIAPIFAVTSDVVSTYQSLSDDLTARGVRPGKVVTLASDSSNIVNAVLSGLDCPTKEDGE